MWIFGYGSLIWRPDFPFLESHKARLQGWIRRFYQGSPDHRGVPDAPGRVVTLLQQEQGFCDGRVYKVAPQTAEEIIVKLDLRESGGYQQHWVEVELCSQGKIGERVESVLLYVASPSNSNFLGADSPDAMAEQIVQSRGASGDNTEYLLRLAEALREMGCEDEHVFSLESLVRKKLGLNNALLEKNRI